MIEPTRQERFETMVLVHVDAAYNLARWLLRDDSGAEDVVQDASLRAFRFFDAMQGASPKAWFIAIVRNACLDWIGVRKRRGLEESFDEGEHGGALLDASGSGGVAGDAGRTRRRREAPARLHRCPALRIPRGPDPA